MKIIIVGGGKFGTKAIEFIKENEHVAILVDRDPKCFAINSVSKKFDDIEALKSKLNELKIGNIYFLCQDISSINDLILLFKPDYVIPVVPIHMMSIIIDSFLTQYSLSFNPNINKTQEFISRCDPNLLLHSSLEQGVVYLSHAKKGETCPDNCAGPPNYCTNFKREKYQTITQYARDFFKIPDMIKIEKNDVITLKIIIESMQLKSGLGGLKGTDIELILNTIKQNIDDITSKTCELIIGTTCNCHGVINFYF